MVATFRIAGSSVYWNAAALKTPALPFVALVLMVNGVMVSFVVMVIIYGRGKFPWSWTKLSHSHSKPPAEGFVEANADFFGSDSMKSIGGR